MAKRDISTPSGLSFSEGFIKAWKTDPKTGLSETVLEKKNTILYQGSDILASALAGQANSAITHMYIGFENATDSSFYSSSSAVAKDGTPVMSGYTSPKGYLRVPLAFPASFTNITDYHNNTAIFTTQIISPSSAGGAVFNPGTSGVSSYIYEAALVAAGSVADRIFSRVTFTPITYDNSYNLTISWGVKFTS